MLNNNLIIVVDIELSKFTHSQLFDRFYIKLSNQTKL